MSYADFEKWMHTKRNLDVLIMDGGQIIAEVKGAKVFIGPERNQNGYPDEFTVLKNPSILVVAILIMLLKQVNIGVSLLMGMNTIFCPKNVMG
jgi:hypothetical protein